MLDNALELLESTENMLRGMLLDPDIPLRAKEAMLTRIAELEMFIEECDLDARGP